MPSDFAMKTMNAVHRVILKLTGGRRGWSVQNMPVLELTTMGRKSGLPRTVLLTSPYQKGPVFVLVASRGGDDNHPAWFLNLSDREANPEVFVRVQGGTYWSVPEILDGEDYDATWAAMIVDRPHYADYQVNTERRIPLVRLVESRPETK